MFNIYHGRDFTANPNERLYMESEVKGLIKTRIQQYGYLASVIGGEAELALKCVVDELTEMIEEIK